MRSDATTRLTLHLMGPILPDRTLQVLDPARRNVAQNTAATGPARCPLPRDSYTLLESVACGMDLSL